jgi:hypothetical protein
LLQFLPSEKKINITKGDGTTQSEKIRALVCTAAGVQFPAGTRDFLYSTASRPVMGPTQPSMIWVPGVLSSGAKRLGPRADQSLQSSVDVKNGGASPPFPLRFHGVVLNEGQGQLHLVYLERSNLHRSAQVFHMCSLKTRILNTNFSVSTFHKANNS